MVLALPFVLVLVSLTLIVYAALYWLRHPFDGLAWSRISGEIGAVEPNTPAAELFKPGDIIYKFDGVPTMNIVEPYKSKQPGDEIELTILRDNQSITHSVQLIKYPLSTRLLQIVPLVVAVIFVLAGAIVRAYSPYLFETNLFYLLSIFAGAALGAGSISAIGPSWASKMFNIIVWWIGPITVHLHAHFPQDIERKTILTYLPIPYTLALIGSIPILIYSTNDLINKEWYSTISVLSRIFLLLNLVVVVALLLSAYWRPKHSRTRHKIRFTSFFGLMSFSLFTSLTILPGIFRLPPVVPYEIGLIPLILIPLSYSYAIYKHRMINVEQMISRGASYTLAITILVIILFAANFYVKDLIPESIRENPLFTILIILLLSLILEPLRKGLQRIVDWIFYGGWYDSHSALLKITEGLDQFNDSSILGEVLAQRLMENLRLTHAYSILLYSDGCYLYPYNKVALESFSVLVKEGNKLKIYPDGPLCHYIIEHPAPIDVQDFDLMALELQLSDEEKHFLTILNEDQIVPIMGKNTLLGILILGPKYAGEIFSSEDFETIGLVSQQAGIAFQNAHLLSEIRERAKEVDELHKEIMRAREEERKRLSRELHDEIIQELVGVNFSLAQLRTQDSLNAVNELRKIITNLRRICAELRPPSLDNLGLVAAVRSRIREIINQNADSINIRFNLQGDENHPIPEDVTLCIYRVFVEALNNAITHSFGDSIEVLISVNPTEVILEVCDDGIGFSVPSKLGDFLSTDHFGIVGIRERLELVNGDLTIKSTPGEGTRLKASVPVETHSETYTNGGSR
jgi:signal transduction histidine kinase